jgi:hypothetical protein
MTRFSLILQKGRCTQKWKIHSIWTLYNSVSTYSGVLINTA